MNHEIVSAVADVLAANARLLNLLVKTSPPIAVREAEMPFDLAAVLLRSGKGIVADETAASPVGQDNIPSQPIPADDENDCAGVFVDASSDVLASEFAATTVPEPQVEPLKAAPKSSTAGDGGDEITLGSHRFSGPPRMIALLRRLSACGPQSADQLSKAGFGSTADTARIIVAKARDVLAKGTARSWELRSNPGVKIALKPREPGTFELVSCEAMKDQARLMPAAETPVPGDTTAAQSEGAAGENPGEEDAATGAGELASRITPDAPAFVTPADMGEGGSSPCDPVSAADDPEIAAPAMPAADRGTAGAVDEAGATPEQGACGATEEGCDVDRGADAHPVAEPTALSTAQAEGKGQADVEAEPAGATGSAVGSGAAIKSDPVAGLLSKSKSRPQPTLAKKPSGSLIEPGDLVAVDIRLTTVHTKMGSYSLDGAVKMARTLDLMKSGSMFGLDHIARIGQWKNAEVAKNALLMETARLKRHGIELYVDRVNARLRVPS